MEFQHVISRYNPKSTNQRKYRENKSTELERQIKKYKNIRAKLPEKYLPERA